MAKNFNDCAKNGGKVLKKKLKNGTVIKTCYDAEGKAHSKSYKNRNKSNKYMAATLGSLNNLVEHFNHRSNK